MGIGDSSTTEEENSNQSSDESSEIDFKKFKADFKADREVVLAAVQSNGSALQYVCPNCQNQEEEENTEIDFKKFNLDELEQICSSIAMLIVDDIASSSYQSIFDCLEITIPDDKEWGYGDDDEGEFFNNCRDLLTNMLGKRIAVACYTDPNSVSDYLDGSSERAWEEAVLNSDPDASVDDITEAINEYV